MITKYVCAKNHGKVTSRTKDISNFSLSTEHVEAFACDVFSVYVARELI